MLQQPNVFCDFNIDTGSGVSHVFLSRIVGSLYKGIGITKFGFTVFQREEAVILFFKLWLRIKSWNFLAINLSGPYVILILNCHEKKPNST